MCFTVCLLVVISPFYFSVFRHFKPFLESHRLFDFRNISNHPITEKLDKQTQDDKICALLLLQNNLQHLFQIGVAALTGKQRKVLQRLVIENKFDLEWVSESDKNEAITFFSFLLFPSRGNGQQFRFFQNISRHFHTQLSKS